MSDILAHAETMYSKLDFEIQTRTYWTYEKYFEAAKMLPELIAEIKKLEAALVEERARRICHTPTDIVGHWPGYEQVVVDEAKLQLHAEGKV